MIWHVVFTDSPRWFLRPLTPGFRHVYACRPDGDRLLYVTVEADRLIVDHVPHPGTDIAAALMESGATAVVQAKAVATGKHLRRGPSPTSCVTVVRMLLGLDAPFVVTPHQLYRRLVRQEV